MSTDQGSGMTEEASRAFGDWVEGRSKQWSSDGLDPAEVREKAVNYAHAKASLLGRPLELADLEAIYDDFERSVLNQEGNSEVTPKSRVFSPGLDVRRFRHFTGIKAHWIFMLGFGVIWGALCLTSHRIDDSQAEMSFPDVNARFVERELILLEAGEDRGWLAKWWTEQEDREESLDQLTDVLNEDDFGLRQTIDEMKSSEVGFDAFSDEEKDTMMGRLMLSESLWYLGVIGAFPALWLVRKDWSRHGECKRMMGAWRPTTVLTVFFVVSLASEYWIFPSTYLVVFQITGDDWGLIWSSLIWRGVGPMLAAFVLVGTWSGIYRVFLGRSSIRWRSIAGVFCILATLEAVRSQIGGESSVVDPTDFFWVTDPRGFEIFFSFVDAAVFAPVFEELMFRGVLFLGLVKRMGAVPSALVSSILFAVAHTQYDGWELVSVGAFGLGCCWLTWRTGSIKSSILLHMIYNALITAGVYAVYQMPL